MTPIPGFPDYFVDESGKVFSMRPLGAMHPRPTVARELQPNVTHGYYHVTLYRDDRAYTRRVHILVLTAFRGSRPPGSVARHLNDVRLDCRLENLQWGSPSDNMRDAILNRRLPCGSESRTAKLTEADVHSIRRLKQTCSYTELARTFGVNKATVKDIIAHRTWKHLPDSEEKVVAVR